MEEEFVEEIRQYVSRITIQHGSTLKISQDIRFISTSSAWHKIDGPEQVESLNKRIFAYCQKQALEGKWDREDAIYFAVALDRNSGLGLINFYIERIKRFYEQYRDKNLFLFESSDREYLEAIENLFSDVQRTKILIEETIRREGYERMIANERKHLPIMSILLTALAMATSLVVTGNIIVNIFNNSPANIEQRQEQNTTVKEGSETDVESSPKDSGWVDTH